MFGLSPVGLKVADSTAVSTAFIGYFFKVIPWPEVAACLAAIYTLLRIIEWLYHAFKR